MMLLEMSVCGIEEGVRKKRTIENLFQGKWDINKKSALQNMMCGLIIDCKNNPACFSWQD